MFRKALFEKYCIRDCVVRLDRSTNSNIFSAFQKKKLLASKGNLRSEISWLPNSSSALMNSSDALSTLAVYHGKNVIVPPIARKNVRRQRVKSIFADNAKSNTQSNDSNKMTYSMNNSSPNLCRTSTHNRSLGPQQPQSAWQIMYQQFKNRVGTKSTKE